MKTETSCKHCGGWHVDLINHQENCVMKAETSHIEACRKRWFEHEDICNECYFSWDDGVHRCDTGVNLYDEYQQAINAHPDCEKVKL
jgi:hypothetical protein